MQTVLILQCSRSTAERQALRSRWEVIAHHVVNLTATTCAGGIKTILMKHENKELSPLPSQRKRRFLWNSGAYEGKEAIRVLAELVSSMPGARRVATPGDDR